MIDRLTSIVPAPSDPIFTGSRTEWSSICEEIAIELPDDLYLLNSTYGAGHFATDDHWLAIHSVFEPRFLHLFEWNRRIFQQEAIESPELYENIFEIGVFGVGESLSNGGRLYWKMTDSLEGWLLGITRPKQVFDMSLLELLGMAFTNEIDVYSSINFPSVPKFYPMEIA